MSKPRKTRMPDPAELAFGIMQRITGETMPTAEPVVDAKKSAAGKIGGTKGGKARANSLSPAKRKAIAKLAASARWGKSSQRSGKVNG